MIAWIMRRLPGLVQLFVHAFPNCPCNSNPLGKTPSWPRRFDPGLSWQTHHLHQHKWIIEIFLKNPNSKFYFLMLRIFLPLYLIGNSCSSILPAWLRSGQDGSLVLALSRAVTVLKWLGCVVAVLEEENVGSDGYCRCVFEFSFVRSVPTQAANSPPVLNRNKTRFQKQMHNKY